MTTITLQPSLFDTVTPQQTKRLSYHETKANGLGAKQRQVLDVIRARGPITDRSIALVLAWPINRVVPRRNELAASGHIRQAGTVMDDETSRRVAAWVAL